MLNGVKLVQVERVLTLNHPIGGREIRAAVESFAIVDDYRGDERMRRQLLDAVVRSLTVAGPDGKHSLPTLDALEKYLGRRRIERFDLKLASKFSFRSLSVRSDGVRVTVKAGACRPQLCRYRARPSRGGPGSRSGSKGLPQGARRASFGTEIRRVHLARW